MKHEFVSEKLSKKQVADRLNCSLRHVDTLIAKGQLQASRVGEKLIRIDSLEVQQLYERGLNGHCVPTHLCQG